MSKRKRLNPPPPQSGNRYSVKEEPTINYNTQKPIFSFHYMNYGGTKCLSRCDVPSQAAISGKLLELSQLTWNQITGAPKQGNGSELIPASQFRVPLPTICTPDVKLAVFRFSHSGRIAGLRIKDVFHLIVVSPNKDLY